MHNSFSLVRGLVAPEKGFSHFKAAVYPAPPPPQRGVRHFLVKVGFIVDKGRLEIVSQLH